MHKLAIWLLALLWRYRSRKQCQVISKFLSLGNDKKKMVALIKELHRNNDGSYKSSNANLWLNIPCGHFRIKHCHGYVSLAYHSGSERMWETYLVKKNQYDVSDLIDFKEEASHKLFPESHGKRWEDY